MEPVETDYKYNSYENEERGEGKEELNALDSSQPRFVHHYSKLVTTPQSSNNADKESEYAMSSEREINNNKYGETTPGYCKYPHNNFNDYKNKCVPDKTHLILLTDKNKNINTPPVQKDVIEFEHDKLSHHTSRTMLPKGQYINSPLNQSLNISKDNDDIKCNDLALSLYTNIIANPLVKMTHEDILTFISR
jgi:hypothetical protein